jgi:ATP-dependent protease ClpP protease subunit
MIHRPATVLQSTTAQGLHVLAKSASLDDARVDSILKSHITLTDEDGTKLDTQNLWFSAEESVRNGTADEVAEFAPPKGTQLFNV